MNLWRKLSLIYLLPALLFGCRHEPKTININTVQIKSFSSGHHLEKRFADELLQFYSLNKFLASWIEDGTLSRKANKFLMYAADNEKHYNGRFIFSPDSLRNSFENKKDISDSILIQTDLSITCLFFDYGEKYLYGLPDEIMKSTGWEIKEVEIDPPQFLDSILNNNVELNGIPVNEHYVQLQKILADYIEIERNGKWNNTRSGDIQEITHKLFLLGDIKNEFSENESDSIFINGVKSFQERHGLTTTGIIDSATAAQLNISPSQRITQLKLNLLRWLKMPEKFENDNVVVNIPEYVLYLYNNNKIQWSCNVVVGSDSTNTVVFNDTMEYIVFSPKWALPKSIIMKETIPEIAKNKNYLQEHNMQVLDKEGNVIDPSDVDWDDDPEKFPYEIFQQPGENNALGKVKFLLPNRHSIYLHDTPAKSLFKEKDRAFSHGCIRVSEPLKLAEYLLHDQSEWVKDSIVAAMNKGEERMVKLKRKIPVYLTYFTAWRDERGRIHFADDIYQLDRKLRKYSD